MQYISYLYKNASERGDSMKIKGTNHHFIRTDDFFNDVHRLVEYALDLKNRDAHEARVWVSDNCDTEEIIDDDCHLKYYSVHSLEQMEKLEALGFSF